MSILKVSGVKKIYTGRFGGNKVEALKSVSFEVDRGEYVAIMGESGSGKTTLLNILAALDTPTSGTVLLDGKDLSKVKESQTAAFRRDNLGFVFQEFNLLDTFSVEDNIYLPLVLAGRPHSEMKARLEPVAPSDSCCRAGRQQRPPGLEVRLPDRSVPGGKYCGGCSNDRQAAEHLHPSYGRYVFRRREQQRQQPGRFL